MTAFRASLAVVSLFSSTVFPLLLITAFSCTLYERLKSASSSSIFTFPIKPVTQLAEHAWHHPAVHHGSGPCKDPDGRPSCPKERKGYQMQPESQGGRVDCPSRTRERDSQRMANVPLPYRVSSNDFPSPQLTLWHCLTHPSSKAQRCFEQVTRTTTASPA